MDTSSSEPAVKCHVVAMPFPGRGHVNPMMNFCKIIAQTQPRTTVITFIVTEEWHGFLSSEPRPLPNIQLATIPNVIPSEIGRAKDWPGFMRAAFTKLESPVEQLLDRLDELLPKPNVIIHDTFLKWVVGVGNRRNIPVASFWTESATVFSIFHHFNLILQKGHFVSSLKEKGKEIIDYIPGALRVADLPTAMNGKGQEVLYDCLEGVALVAKAQYLLITSTYELEPEVFDALRKYFDLPVYSIGPAIPKFNLSETETSTTPETQPEYVSWLDAQPEKSVLYISQGSFLSVSNAQLDEVVAGVHESGVRFLWVTRDYISSLEKNGESGNCNGIVVPWCDQQKVLSHSSIGGFWSHCGWNSTKEAIFSGIPVLAFPIFWDQPTNAKQIVDDWKIGWRVKKDDEDLVTRGEIAGLVRKFMDLGSEEGREIRRRARELQTICREAAEEGGSSKKAIDAFLDHISFPKR